MQVLASKCFFPFISVSVEITKNSLKRLKYLFHFLCAKGILFYFLTYLSITLRLWTVCSWIAVMFYNHKILDLGKKFQSILDQILNSGFKEHKSNKRVFISHKIYLFLFLLILLACFF